LGAECDLKTSHREPVFAPLWKRSLEAIDPDLAKRVEIVSWSEELLPRCDAAVAYGADSTLAKLRTQTPIGCRFISYGHKMSVAILREDALGRPDLLDQLEKDVAPFDLEGCLSPQVIYLEGEDPGIFEGLFARVRVMPRLKRFESWPDLKAELQDFM